LWLFQTDIHLLGTGQPDGSAVQLFLFGVDRFGRDLFTRTLIGGRVSLAIGLVAPILAVLLGIFFGGLSGFYGGWLDIIIQRIIEVLQSIPQLPLLLVLSTVLPKDLSQGARLLGIIVIISATGWTGIARVLRGQILAFREQEYTLAARAMGASDNRIIFRHLLPNTMSYLIVVTTLSIPGFILTEAALSFLGLGIHEPATSWGLLLSAANSIFTLANHWWLLIPGFFIIVSVLAFNFMGDALRDAVDPYASIRG
jgi:peptide/nickel transport system permease protein